MKTKFLTFTLSFLLFALVGKDAKAAAKVVRCTEEYECVRQVSSCIADPEAAGDYSVGTINIQTKVACIVVDGRLVTYPSNQLIQFGGDCKTQLATYIGALGICR